VPLFYERVEGPVPRRWVRRVKSSLISLGPRVVASRMVRDYVQQMYEPVAQRAEALTASGNARARELAAWKTRVVAGWPRVHVDSVESDAGLADLGSPRTVTAEVALGVLTGGDVQVQLAHGPVGPNDEIVDPQVVPMDLVGSSEKEGHYRYSGSFSCEKAGRYGFSVRVVPSHPDLAGPAEMGCVTWA
jgi:starch phosphorylase